MTCGGGRQIQVLVMRTATDSPFTPITAEGPGFIANTARTTETCRILRS
jgi:hypothetical protein